MEFDVKRCNPVQGLNYVVPLMWWRNFCSNNEVIRESASLRQLLPRADIRPLVDTLILDFEEHYVEELTEKSNFMNLSKRVLCPQLLQGVHLGQHYQALPPSIVNPAILFAFKDYKATIDERIEVSNGLTIPIGIRQFQFIFCSKKASSLFICYLPRHAQILWCLREIFKTRNLIEMPQSRVIALDEKMELASPLGTLQGRKISDLRETESLLMVINLVDGEEEDTSFKVQLRDVPMDDGFLSGQTAVADHKTQSTGASTPLTLSHNSSFRQENQQLMEMIRQKSQEQIQEMKERAQQSILGDLIEIRECSLLQAEQQLALLADKLLEMAGTMHKKKTKEIKQK